ncbi:hypothetical protein EMGBS6_13070, partial [Opitutia bacterium]
MKDSLRRTLWISRVTSWRPYASAF